MTLIPMLPSFISSVFILNRKKDVLGCVNCCKGCFGYKPVYGILGTSKAQTAAIEVNV